MNDNTAKNKVDPNSKSSSSTSKLGGMLSGRISGDISSTRNPDKALEAMMRSTSPKTKNSGELTFIQLDVLLPFPDHPFKLYEGTKLNELVESIKEIGVVNAIIIRKILDQPHKYQILSGHNRVNAAKLAGLKQIKAEVVDVDDDTAALIVVDCNFKQRQSLLPSERAYGFKMQLDVLKRQGKRTDLYDDENQNIKARDIIGKGNDLSGFQISNYLRLIFLISPLLEKVDEAVIPLKAGIVLSHIAKEKQMLLDNFITKNEYRIDYEKAQKLRNILCDDIFSEEVLKKVFEETTSKKSNLVKLSRKDLKRFFPEDINSKEIIKRIYEILEKYSS